jgi:hypothetical protein
MTTTHDQELTEAAELQHRKHEADPVHEPMFLGCDDEPQTDYTMGMPEEEDA